MPKHIATASGDLTIEIGTREDDKRIAADCLYLKAAQDGREIRTLTQGQALELAAVLLETVRKLPRG